VKYVDEFRAPEAVRALLGELHEATTGPWRIMEVCGGQTHAFVRFGLDQLLPDALELLHGPGCPVCVTPVGVIDQALELASRPGVVLCTFGDMLRVPGSARDLRQVRARGGDVRVVTSVLDAVQMARDEPARQVVFFSVGFETTAPGAALAVRHAHDTGVDNFSILAAHVLVPPALEALADDDDCAVDAFLAAGHVCTVMGTEAYEAFVARHQLPVVITGFEPVDLLRGLLAAVRQLEAGVARVDNRYPRAVQPRGNPAAQQVLAEVFEVVDPSWRGLGRLPRSGLALRDAFEAFDAAKRFGLAPAAGRQDPRCRAGDVLRGVCKPVDCEAFGTGCTPDAPLGAPMVSAEGACAAYYQQGRHRRGRRP